MKVEIEITLEDLGKGEKMNIRKNPVALAVNRVLRSGYRSTVGISDFCIFFESKESSAFEACFAAQDGKQHALLPDELRNANIQSFSYPALKPVGKYEIEIPDKFLRSEITEVK